MFNFTYTCYFKDPITGELSINVISVVANSRFEAEQQIQGLPGFYSIIMMDSVIEQVEKQKKTIAHALRVKKIGS